MVLRLSPKENESSRLGLSAFDCFHISHGNSSKVPQSIMKYVFFFKIKDRDKKKLTQTCVKTLNPVNKQTHNIFITHTQLL